MEESNFVVTITGKIDEHILVRLTNILDMLGAILIGDKKNDNVIEYFYAIKEKHLSHTKKILTDQIKNINVSFMIMGE